MIFIQPCLPTGERDKYMANAILSADFKTLVAVVGIAHLKGLYDNLITMGDFIDCSEYIDSKFAPIIGGQALQDSQIVDGDDSSQEITLGD